MDTTAIPDLHRLVEQIRLLTDAALPEILEPDSPVLHEDSLDDDGAGFYLVGIIGGKNVGKSALVNAIVGEEITVRTSHGAGTDRVIAYAHTRQAAALVELLEREVPGQYEIVTHHHDHLVRQVLLDLPDFDSHYTAHLEITRRMLRHMIYPVWLQSIEKYADRQPRELLRKVTAGNDPRNLVFCLNKVDQLERAGQWDGAEEIRSDYGERIRQALGLPESPRVWLVSALRPDSFELPAFRQTLTCERSEQDVSQSRHLAARQQVHSLVDWIARQRLPERLERVRRLESQAQETIVSQVGAPIFEKVAPGVVGDATWLASATDETMRRRVARWPILNMMHLLLEPALAALRGRIIPTTVTLDASASDVVGAHLSRLSQPLPFTLQATFAQLQQSSPLMSQLYADGRLWEQMRADQQVGTLRQRLAEVLETRASAVRDRLSRRGSPIRALSRFILTIGAAVWFVAAQPFLQIFLNERHLADAPGSTSWITMHELIGVAVILVQIFSVVFLLRSLVFLAGYYLVLWLMLRWRTQVQVERRLRRSSRREPALSAQLTAVSMEWIQELLAPIRRAREQLEALIAESKRFTTDASRAAA